MIIDPLTAIVLDPSLHPGSTIRLGASKGFKLQGQGQRPM